MLGRGPVQLQWEGVPAVPHPLTGCVYACVEALYSYSGEESLLHPTHYLLLELAHTLIHQYALKTQHSKLTRYVKKICLGRKRIK